MSDPSPFEELAHLDRAVHEPTRLAILTALAACERADFVFLQRITGLTVGNLSAHLAKLEAAGMVVIEKRFVEKKTQTMVRLSESGRGALEAYWKTMETARKRAARWMPHAPALPARLALLLGVSVLLALALLGGAASVSATEFPPITDAELALKTVPGQPNAPAAVLFRKGSLRLLDPAAHEVSSYLVVEVREKILTEAGKKRGDVEIAHSGWFRLQGFEGRTVLPDGTVVPLPKDAQFEVTRSRSHRVSVTKVAFPSVAVGAILDYHYTIKWDSILFLDPWIFQDRIPVVHSEIAYDVPGSLGVTAWRSDPMGVGIHTETVAIKGGSRLRAWGDNLPAVPEEVYSLPFTEMAAEEVVLTTEYGTAGRPRQPLFVDWTATAKRWDDEFYMQARRRTGDAEQKAREIAAGVRGLPKGASRQRAQAEAVYDFVRDEIETERSARIALSKDASVGAVLAERRGETAGRALLLQTMLSALKIDSRLVWAANREEGAIHLEIPNPVWFDRVLVAATIDGQRVFLDTSDRALCFGHLEPGYEGTQALLLERAKPEVITLPEAPFDQNVRHVQLDVTLDANGRATGSGTFTLSGQPAWQRTRWTGSFTDPGEASRDRLAKDFHDYDISGVEVAESLDEPKVVVKWTFSQHAEEALGDQATIVTSRPFGPVRQQFPKGAKRLSPVALPFAERDEIDLTVHWAAGWQPEVLPTADRYETFAGAVVTSVDVDAAQRTLHFHRRFDKSHWKTVTAEQFDLVQNLFEEAQKVDAESLVLARR